MQDVYRTAKSLTKRTMHYCPGCAHGIIHKLVAEAIDELGIRENTIGVAPVGCAVLAYNYFDMDFAVAAHGRAPAMATGIKRVHPDKIVFTYQGDGDLASIGTAEIVHASMRGEKITVIFVNNAIYGMTGGQMAPTTLVGQKTSTSPYGRQAEHCGSPIRMSEMLSTIPGAYFVSRVSVSTPGNLAKAKRTIKKAFQNQMEGKGLNIVEVLSTCPTNWGRAPYESMKWVDENMQPYYPLGDYKQAEEAK